MTDGTQDANPTEQPAVALADGHRMPLLGLGTWQSESEDAYRAVRHALDIGYRHVDTAKAYGNEEQVGRAIRDSGVPRAEIFLTTKLPPDDAGREAEVIRGSLRRLGTDYVDLWLVHWPPNGSAAPDTWRGFLAAREEGLARSVGVSNYSVAQLDELADATGVMPAVNQVPWSPLQHDTAVYDAHADRGVVLEGYSPLKGGTLTDETISAVARAHGVTPAQVILRWHLDKDIVAIPKSVRPERIEENLDVFGFSLPPDEVATLDALGS